MTYTTACRFRPPADNVGDAVINGRFKKRMRLAEVPRSGVLETMLSMIGKGDSSIQVQHKLAQSLSVEGFESEAVRMFAALSKEPGAIESTHTTLFRLPYLYLQFSCWIVGTRQ